MRETVAPLAKQLGVRLFEPPLPLPEIELHLVWHERNDRDGGHSWLRETLVGLFDGRP